MIKKKKIEEKQRIERRKKIQLRKSLRKFNCSATKVDTFFSENCSLSFDEKRALIAENMRHSVAFPCFTLPTKESQQTIVAAGNSTKFN
jgi:hypothetical protein